MYAGGAMTTRSPLHLRLVCILRADGLMTTWSRQVELSPPGCRRWRRRCGWCAGAGSSPRWHAHASPSFR
eukprot:9625-Eustigmatos_ZCMA.PRE.1